MGRDLTSPKCKQGYYEDMASPIASTPLKQRKRRIENEDTLPKKSISPDVRKRKSLDDSQHWGEKVVELFSPVLQFFQNGSDTENSKSFDNSRSRNISMNTSLNSEISSLGGDEGGKGLDESSMEEAGFCPYVFMRALPKYEELTLEKPKIGLPPGGRHGKPTLVLDLDETLVHCSIEELENPDVTFKVEYDEVEYTIYARKRPHMEKFLRCVSELFEVVVFTASQQAYAEKLLDILDPCRELIHHRLYRDSCLLVEGNYLKDLHVLGRELSKVLLVDNSPHAFGYQVSNGIPIESWFEDKEDTELLKLLPFLKSLLKVKDVRPVLTRQFKLQELIDAVPLSFIE